LKTEGQILHKLKQVQFRSVKKELDRFLSVRPENCSNHRTLTSKQGAVVGVCSLDCTGCEGERAQGCPTYRPRYDKEVLKESLRHFFETRGPEEVSARFPAVAALLWVLREGDEPFPYTEDPARNLAGVPFWTDSSEEARQILDHVKGLEKKIESLFEEKKALEIKWRMEEQRVLSLEERNATPAPPAPTLPWWKRIFQ
jgi:hypothetical protein